MWSGNKRFIVALVTQDKNIWWRKSEKVKSAFGMKQKSMRLYVVRPKGVFSPSTYPFFGERMKAGGYVWVLSVRSSSWNAGIQWITLYWREAGLLFFSQKKTLNFSLDLQSSLRQNNTVCDSRTDSKQVIYERLCLKDDQIVVFHEQLAKSTSELMPDKSGIHLPS